MVLLVDAGAPLTSTPAIARLLCRPINKGKPGAKLLVVETPVMVVKSASERVENTRDDKVEPGKLSRSGSAVPIGIPVARSAGGG